MNRFVTEMPGAAAGDGPLGSPFDDEPPPLARQAAEILQHELAQGWIAPGVSADPLWEAGGGKMFGVLVVATEDGRVGFLRAFSGMLARAWEIHGFVPPLFDPQARAAIELTGEAAVTAQTARAREYAAGPELAEARRRYASLRDRQRAEHQEMIARYRASKAERREQRRVLAAAEIGGPDVAARLHALAQESRRDKAERRRFDARQAEEEEASARQLAAAERRRGALERLHAMASRRLMREIHDCYSIRNACGEAVALRQLFAPDEPPSGAADCAAPKLLGFAHRYGLRPLALAEFWWGAPPPAGGRVAGRYYRACRDKCGPLLPFMLRGLDVAAARPFVPPRLQGEGLTIVHADERIVVIDKPSGLLSVPGAEGDAGDSVLQRLQRLHPAASSLLAVHRLDLDTSGVLVFALDAVANAHVQKQFIRRTVKKRYVAWIDAVLDDECGTIELPIRTDINDRPRQIVDPTGGRQAITDWVVLERRGGRTRVALFPRTGRTHQLRVHAAHPDGLGAAIVGDRLYGHGGERLLLHAEAITVRHPANGAWMTFSSPAPF